MNLEKLKEQARRHEQKEEWPKALDLYEKAIRKLKDEEQPDIGVFNRAGDIQARIGNLDGAVKHYERAVELYLEAELPNNAIAVCKKVLRNLPARATAYLRMGQIRASQGFLTDARQNFIAYAELMQQAGEMEEAFRALIEFIDLAPHDMDIRAGVAAQLASHGSISEAVEQLTVIYRHHMREGAEEAASQIRDQILELDPEAEIPTEFGSPIDDVGDSVDDLGFETTSLGLDEGLAGSDDEEEEYEFGEIEIGGGPASAEEESSEVQETEIASSMDGLELTDVEVGDDLDDDEEETGLFEIEPSEEGEDELELDAGFAEIAPPDDVDSGPDDEEDIDLDLPLMSFDEEDEGDEGGDLPMLDFEEEEDGEGKKISEGAALHLDDLGEVDVEGFGADVEGELDVEADPADPGPAAEHEVAAEAAGRTEAGWEDIAFDAGRETEGASTEDAAPGPQEEAPGEEFEAVRRKGELLLEEGEIERGLEALRLAHEGFAARGMLDRAMRVVREVILKDPDNPAHHQTLVEYAYRVDDRTLLIPAFVELAECLARTGESGKASAVYQQVLLVDPGNRKAAAALSERRAAPPTGAATAPAGDSGGGGDGFLDLGSMVLDDTQERTTRWKVSAEAPSGDEEADFRRLLSQFKSKVAENVSQDDFKAHYDLGTAYKEMGLLEEAIGQFQQALRASGGDLATYEMLGQCFLDGGQHEVALRTLKRALDIPWEVEDELLGIYYHLARAYEVVNDTEQAVDFYEKVFSLDINFMDVTERLRALRP